MDGRSNAYQFTVTDKKDQRLLALRSEVNARNAEHRKKGEPVEVVALLGRLGKDNPNRGQMINRYGQRKSSVPHGIAVRFDVYLRRKGVWSRPKFDYEAHTLELERMAIRDGKTNWLRHELNTLLYRARAEKGITLDEALLDLSILVEGKMASVEA